MIPNVRKIAEKCNTDISAALHIRYAEPMSAHTTFKTGGQAALFFEPETEAALAALLAILRDAGTDWFILGGGSNIVVSDEGFDIPVISTRRLRNITLERTARGTADGLLLRCGAGSSFDDICRYCERHALGGLEDFAGLPGTAGGAAYMNARCYGVSISDVLYSAHSISGETGRQTAYICSPDDWDYKRSPFQQTKEIITEVCFRVRELSAQEQQQSREHAAARIADRMSKGHFDWPSAGSVFKNNRAFGKPTGKIIEEAGLRGISEGGAQVAPWHGNFIVNTGAATAADIRRLVSRVAREVYEQTGFRLECEIIFCGAGAAQPDSLQP